MIKTHRRLATALVGGLAILALAACGANGTSTGGAQGAPSGNASGQPGGGSGGGPAGGGIPGVSGLIVALSGKTMQVRTTSGQSTVSFTTKTTVTEQKSAKSSDVKVGVCAVVRSADQSSSGSGASTPVAASSVSLSDEVDGSCQGGFGGGGDRPSGQPSGAPGGSGGQAQPPGGAPSGAMPSGAVGSGARADGGRGGFGGTVGKVTAVSGSTVTIEQSRGTEKTSVTVNLTPATTYTQQVKTDTSSIAKNLCVFGSGKSDSTGALAATALRLSAPVNGECSVAGQGRRNASGAQSGG